MSSFRVNPSPLQGGTITVPGDKSISHRALMFGAIAEGVSEIDGLLLGEDCLATLSAIEAMGVAVERDAGDRFIVHGVGLHGLEPPAGALDLGNSGTGMRLFAGLLAGQTFDTRLTGDASLSARPMGRVIDPLGLMGAHIGSSGGRPPLHINGGRRLSGIDYPLPVASAQVKSAVLLAGLYADGTTCVTEPAVTRDHTERMLRSMQVQLTAQSGQVSLEGGQQPAAVSIRVPGDLSSAAFLIVAALLAESCELCIEGVGINPTRNGVIDILKDMGADIVLERRREAGAEPIADLLIRSSELRGIDVAPERVSLAIDEFPVLFIAAAAAKGRSRFTGLEELRVKESDRIAAMVDGLRALGIEAVDTPGGAEIQGGRFQAGAVDSRGDHRIAMAFAVAGLTAAGPVRVTDTAPVETSFPGFAALLRTLGADIRTKEGETS